MDSLLPFFLLCFTSFFTLTNPLGTMPVFLTMTNGMSEEQRRALVRRATIVSFLTLMVFTFSGQFLFKFFGISTNGFRIAAVSYTHLGRILYALKERFPQLAAVELKLSKLNPPFGGDVHSASIILGETFS